MELGTIDRRADRPPYKQIADQLRAAIESGELSPGDRIPSEATLIDHYGVARMTVRQAIQELRAEARVVAEHGRGVFVRTPVQVRRLASERFARRHREAGLAAFGVEAEKTGFTPRVDQLEVSTALPSEEIRDRLRLAADEEVVVRSRRYLADGQPVETAISYVPAVIAADTAIAAHDSGPGGIYARLEELGHELDHFTEEVSARMPSADERDRLQLFDGVPVIVVVRTAYETTGRPVEVCDTLKAASAYILEYDIPAR
ncbi:GntR family transcriptional regulator [Pseudonocardia sp. NPDC046786]|uniref:GntR family transcriptional regulator n=1 Tax=Pseudonocardia sp. NPDC046786 TaxID=3155471 RepID=UPI0033EE829C